jgi:hypothetical protein
MKKRNLYPDGEYFIRLSDLSHHHDSIKDLLKTYFGEKFDMNMNEYFKNTKKLVVIDDFSKIASGNRYPYPTFFLRALRVNNIHAVFITRQKNTPPIEEVDPCIPWQLKSMSKQQALAYMLVANKRALFKVDADISSIENCTLIEKLRGDPNILNPRLDLVLALLNHRDRFRKFSQNSRYMESDDEEDPPFLKRVDNFQDELTSVSSLQMERRPSSRGGKRFAYRSTKKPRHAHYHTHKSNHIN